MQLKIYPIRGLEGWPTKIKESPHKIRPNLGSVLKDPIHMERTKYKIKDLSFQNITKLLLCGSLREKKLIV